MLNSTINATINQTVSHVSYEQVIAVTQNTAILSWIAITWFVPILIYLIVGAVVRGRSSSGAVMSKPMICSPNYWYAFIIWAFIQLSLFILLVFPVWLRFLD